jgi:hypothetical protein
MALFTKKCKHQWGAAVATFAPPISEITNLMNSTPRGLEFALKITYGISTVSQLCGHCGIARSYTVAGQAEMPAPVARDTDSIPSTLRVSH